MYCVAVDLCSNAGCMTVDRKNKREGGQEVGLRPGGWAVERGAK